MAASSAFPCGASPFKTKNELLNELLKCALCHSHMSSPCCLPCAHAFCRSCLLKHAHSNPVHTSGSLPHIRCPHCTFQLTFSSLAHLDSLLVVNPTLKQLCELLEPVSDVLQARCHTCCMLQVLKICKHCSFMLCATCRRTHLLEVHRESKAQLDVLDARLRSINDKRAQLDHTAREYDHMREQIHAATERLFHAVAQQRHEALQMLETRQQANEEIFWTSNGFDSGEKFDFFASLLHVGRQKLSAKNITDRDLMELSDNLQTIPDVDEKRLDGMDFSQLSLVVDESLFTEPFIHVQARDTAQIVPEKLLDDRTSE